MRIDCTYETENTTSELETFEWDNPWWEQAPDTKKTRVLYIGDSISYGIRRHATEISENTLLFDNFSTSKALDNPYFADSLALFAKQERRTTTCPWFQRRNIWPLKAAEFSKSCTAALFQALLPLFRQQQNRRKRDKGAAKPD